MPKKILSPKVVVDPVYGIIDIRPVLAMVETEEFQALGDKRQLGMSHIVFPSATHTRLARTTRRASLPTGGSIMDSSLRAKATRLQAMRCITISATPRSHM